MEGGSGTGEPLLPELMAELDAIKRTTIAATRALNANQAGSAA
jgi:hypothetical protein